MAHILAIDDDPGILALIEHALRREGHTITCMPHVPADLAAHLAEYDLILLDVMMPQTDGYELCSAIRDDTDCPILFLTAKTMEEDVDYGFSVGADDYITKPFSPIVLAARVRTLLKREGRAGAPLEQLGKLSVNELRREVMVENKPIDLTPKEYELLIYFKNNRAIALSRESILNAVWGYDYFGDLRTVDTHVKKLRAKLGECGTMIETVRGYGYRFEV